MYKKMITKIIHTLGSRIVLGDLLEQLSPSIKVEYNSFFVGLERLNPNLTNQILELGIINL